LSASTKSARGEREEDLAALWLPQLLDLADRIRTAARTALVEAVVSGSLESIARSVGQGAGDVTFGLDVPTERVLDLWLREAAAGGPLSLLTEESGWRHMGPDSAGRPSDLRGFDHGGPRIVVDPIDGTRMLMADMRSAWTVIGFASPGNAQPSLSDVSAGVLSEIPDSRGGIWRRMRAVRGQGCTYEERRLTDGYSLSSRRMSAGADDRADRGFFPFFKYMPDQRPAIATIEAEFLARLAQDEGADVRSCWDDQYISNAGQLALLALGSYRMIADLRAWHAQRHGRTTLTSKPYDVSGAVLCAQEAGCIVEAVDGGKLDFPLDAKTPVSFVGWANAATRKRLAPHLHAALGSGTPR
jgi:fructose-1,6-bisphosphatase/inositol monophosphatase family enzyme